MDNLPQSGSLDDLYPQSKETYQLCLELVKRTALLN